MATIDARLPPLDGSLNGLPGFVDFHAKHNPNRALYVFPYTDLNSDELRTTSYSDFAQATHRVAHTLRPKREGPDGLVVAIIANVDSVLYHVMLVGLIRAGCVPFAMSPRNSALAIASMMERTQCHHIVSQPAFTGIISEVRSALPSGYSVQIDEVPSLSSVLPSLALTPPDPVTEPEPYPSPLQDLVPTSVALYLHSSGSTGHPKPVPQTHEFLRNWCRFPVVLHGRLHAVGWGAHALPPFHTMAIAVQLLAPLVSGCPTSLFPPRAVEGDPPVIPTPQNTILNARKTSCGILATVPSFVEAWAHNDEDVKYLASLKLLIFAGGPLSKVNGDKLVARGVHLSAGYGATETGSIMKMPFVNTNVPDPDAKSPEDWEWIIMPDECKPRWEDQGDGTYELQLLTCPTHRPAVEDLTLSSGERGCSTSDLWIPHPTKPGLWKIVGRKDDVIVLGTGEKTVPIPLEGHIGAHPLVKGVIAFGRGHQQVGILVEAKPGPEVDPTDHAEVMNFRNAMERRDGWMAVWSDDGA